MTAGFAQKYSGPNGAKFACKREAAAANCWCWLCLKATEAQKEKLRNDCNSYLKHRKSVETEMVSGFKLFHLNTPESMAAFNFASKDPTTKLQGCEDLVNTLIPRTFPVGGKRPTPGNAYLEALVTSNVTVFQEAGLEKIAPFDFIDPAGSKINVDVIILVPGFNTSLVPRFLIIAYGTNLQGLDSNEPVGYLGVAAPRMPNWYFTVYGPYGPLASGSAMPIITAFVNYIVQMIHHMQVEDIKSVTPLSEAINQYPEHTSLFTDRTVWNAPCRSWFKDTSLEMMRKPRLQDYRYVYGSKNLWSWLDSGFLTRDFDGRDLTWYFGLVDGENGQREYDAREMEFGAEEPGVKIGRDALSISTA